MSYKEFPISIKDTFMCIYYGLSTADMQILHNIKINEQDYQQQKPETQNQRSECIKDLATYPVSVLPHNCRHPILNEVQEAIQADTTENASPENISNQAAIRIREVLYLLPAGYLYDVSQWIQAASPHSISTMLQEIDKKTTLKCTETGTEQHLTERELAQCITVWQIKKTVLLSIFLKNVFINKEEYQLSQTDMLCTLINHYVELLTANHAADTGWHTSPDILENCFEYLSQNKRDTTQLSSAIAMISLFSKDRIWRLPGSFAILGPAYLLSMKIWVNFYPVRFCSDFLIEPVYNRCKAIFSLAASLAYTAFSQIHFILLGSLWVDEHTIMYRSPQGTPQRTTQIDPEAEQTPIVNPEAQRQGQDPIENPEARPIRP